MKDTVKTRITLAGLFILLLCIMPNSGMEFDSDMWKNWAVYIHQHGLGNAYANPLVGYHPVYLYVIYVYTQIMGSETLIVQNIHYLKAFTLIFDFLPIIVLCCFQRKLIKEKIPYLLLLLNIAYLYNTLIWGQVDSIYTSLVFLAILIGINKPVPGFLLFLLAFNTKPQVIIFVPLMLLVLMYSIRNFRQILMILVTGAIIQTLILLPFILTGSLGQMYYTLTHQMDYYHHVSIGAFNMWYLIFMDAYHTMDYDTFLFLSYKQIGIILFFASSAPILLTVLFRLIKEYKAKTISDNTKQMLFLASGLIALYFFYFNTQMHERYSHPMLLFFFFYAVYSKNYKLYILASIPYFLSLEKCYPDFFPIPHYKIIFAMKIIALWYTLLLFYGSYLFYKEYKPMREWKGIKSLL